MEGRLDTLNAPAFLKLYEDMAEKENIKSVELEIHALDYMSSTGLRVLLRISKQLGKENVIVKHPNTVIHEILKGSGFDKVVTIQ